MTTLPAFPASRLPLGAAKALRKEPVAGLVFLLGEMEAWGRNRPSCGSHHPRGLSAVCNITVLQLKTGSRRLPGGQETLLFHTVPGRRESRQELEG